MRYELSFERRAAPADDREGNDVAPAIAGLRATRRTEIAQSGDVWT
jgi:hypothetical protein